MAPALKSEHTTHNQFQFQLKTLFFFFFSPSRRPSRSRLQYAPAFELQTFTWFQILLLKLFQFWSVSRFNNLMKSWDNEYIFSQLVWTYSAVLPSSSVGKVKGVFGSVLHKASDVWISSPWTQLIILDTKGQVVISLSSLLIQLLWHKHVFLKK